MAVTEKGTTRRQAMTEAGWIIMDAISRAVKEYDLSNAELTAIVLHELNGWTKAQLGSGSVSTFSGLTRRGELCGGGHR